MASERSTLDLHLDPLRPFLDDQQWTEVCINRPGEVFTESKEGWTCHQVDTVTQAWCIDVGRLLANSTKQNHSGQNPILSAQLPDGERVQVVIPPAVPEGTTSITIRKPSDLLFGLDDFEAQGVFDDVVIETNCELEAHEHKLLNLLKAHKIKDFITEAVRTKQNFVISGATGSGKTTFAKGIIQEIPSHERLITIEDVLELKLPNHPNHVRLIYSKDAQGLAKVTPKQLLESCLRMKPDRILLSELRSDEAYYYLRNVNSGHPGSITTVHANTPALAFEQLMLLVKESSGGSQLSREDIKSLLYTLVDVIIQFKNIRGRGRVVTGIYYDPYAKRQKSK